MPARQYYDLFAQGGGQNARSLLLGIRLATRGDDIDAACGQLVGQVMDRTRRSERYIAVRQLAESESAANRN